MSSSHTSAALRRARLAFAVGGVLAVAAPAAIAASREAPASPQTSESRAAATGGLAVPGRPVVRSASCRGFEPWACARGQILTLRGESLHGVRTVIFEGAGKNRDDARVKISTRSTRSSELLVVVPRRARSGRLRIVSALGSAPRTPRELRVRATLQAKDHARGLEKLVAGGTRKALLRYQVTTQTSPDARVEAVRVRDGRVVRTWKLAPDETGAGEVRWDGFVGKAPARGGAYVLRLSGEASTVARASADTHGEIDLLEGIYPIRGKHTPARSAMQRFGGGRSHQGSDNFAKCGTPLAAWTKGKVQFVGSHGAAGNYVVIARPNGESYAYMHMRSRAQVAVGDEVFAGQRLGRVGATGRASGCHLHFETWTAPGWQRGGRAYDPGPLLRRLDKGS